MAPLCMETGRGMFKRYGLMICGHGSRNQNAVREFSVLAERMRTKFPHWLVDYGYLEFANPVITHGLDALKAKGVNHILAVPGMLFAAGHAKNDIPSVLNTWAAQNPDIKIDYGRELGIDLKMIRAAGDRIRLMPQSGCRVDYKAILQRLLFDVGQNVDCPIAISNHPPSAALLTAGLGVMARIQVLKMVYAQQCEGV